MQISYNNISNSLRRIGKLEIRIFYMQTIPGKSMAKIKEIPE